MSQSRPKRVRPPPPAKRRRPARGRYATPEEAEAIDKDLKRRLADLAGRMGYGQSVEGGPWLPPPPAGPDRRR